MNLKSILKTILFIIISAILLISLSGCTKSEITTSSKIEVDNQFDPTLSSINTILERNDQYEYVDNIIKNLEIETYSYTLNIFGKENNDKQIMKASNRRLAEVEKGNFKILNSLI